MVPLTRPQIVTFCAMTLPSIRALSPIIRSEALAFDSAEDLRWTIAFDFAYDRHAGADARVRSRFRPFRLRRDCLSDQTLRLQVFEVICDRAQILLGYLALEAIQHAHLPFRLRRCERTQSLSRFSRRSRAIILPEPATWASLSCHPSRLAVVHLNLKLSRPS